MRDLEDTLQVDAEFKRSLQSNIEELYKERKSAKATADAQIAALQADLSRLHAGQGDVTSKSSSAETEALLQEKSAALMAARAEVRLNRQCADD